MELTTGTIADGCSNTMSTLHKKPRAIIICGPTGIGKTGFAIELARKFKGEIIGADSMQIYRRMDIGTAKPTQAERFSVVHHMVDIVDPDEPFDAETYAGEAFQRIVSLEKRGAVPFVAGGTGLYIKALVRGLFDAAPMKPVIRDRLRREAAANGSPFLHRRLAQIDP